MYPTRTFLLLLFSGLFLVSQVSYGQMPRQRANAGGPVDEVFWSPNLIMSSSVTNHPQGSVNFTIKHVFGILTNGPEDLFGLDASANIRFGLDFSVLDRLSIGFGRSRYDKLYDFRFKANLLRQTRDNRIPLEVAIQGSTGINTLKNGFDLADRFNYASSLMIARKFSDQISLQISPIYSHFNTVFIERGANDEIIAEENSHLAVSFAGKFAITETFALLLEYIPVFGDRSDQTKDVFAVGFDLETGGHVFQLFFTPSQAMTEQHVIAQNVDDFFAGDFRFGFNVHRVFSY